MHSDPVLAGHYDGLTLTLSILIPILGSYVALDLAQQVPMSKGSIRLKWLLAATTAMAIAIWSMHYTAMLALQLPVPVWYDVRFVILCFFIAFCSSTISLLVATRKRFDWDLAVVAALFIGAAIVGLHYIAMLSMRMAARQHYSLISIIMASAVAVGASLLALWLIFRPREKTWAITWGKSVSAGTMGGAIAGMHYTAMAGTVFIASIGAVSHPHAVHISPLGTLASVLVVSTVLVFMLLAGVTVESSGSAAKFRSMNETLRSEISERERAQIELGRLSGQLLRAQDEERRRIARDLHDSTTQHLVLLSADLQQLAHIVPSKGGAPQRLLREANDLLSRALNEVRTLSYILHPPMLDESGLEDAIAHYIEGFSKRSGIQVDLQVSGHLGRLQMDAEIALFRVMQESLRNVQLHAGSHRAFIRIDVARDGVILEIRDEGRGIVRTEGGGHAMGVGILSMRERLRQLGGWLDIESASGGTTVRARIPMNGKTD